MDGALAIPYVILVYLNKPTCVLMVNNSCDCSFTFNCEYAPVRSSTVNTFPPDKVAKISSTVGNGYCSGINTLFTDTRKSTHIRTSPSFLCTITIGDAQLLLETGFKFPPLLAILISLQPLDVMHMACCTVS